jgi:hypothetical protein
MTVLQRTTVSFGLLIATAVAGCSDGYKHTAESFFVVEEIDLAPIIEPPSDQDRRRLFDRMTVQATSYSVLNAVLSQPDIAELACVKQATTSYQEPTDWLAEHTTVSTSPDAGTFTLNVSGPTPEAALKLCQAVTDAFVKYVVVAEKKHLLKNRNTLARIYDNKSEMLRKKREDLRMLARDLGYNSDKPNPETMMINDSLRVLRKRISALTMQLMKKEQALTFAQAEQRREAGQSQKSTALKNKTPFDSRGKPTDNPKPAAENSGPLRPEDVQDIDAEILAIEKMEREIAFLKQQREKTQMEYLNLANGVSHLSEYSADLERRKDELEMLSKVVNELGMQLQRFDLQMSVGVEPVRLVSPPHVVGFEMGEEL